MAVSEVLVINVFMDYACLDDLSNLYPYFVCFTVLICHDQKPDKTPKAHKRQSTEIYVRLFPQALHGFR